MILSAQSIRKRCVDSKLIDPFCERTYQFGLSYGLGPASYDFRIAQDVSLYPGCFVKASTVEHFNIPHDLCGVIYDKSTWARRGLSLFNTVFDPGFRGYATLELVNLSTYQLEIKSGMAIGQIEFQLLDEPTEQPYNGKFQDQPQGPQ